MSNRKPTDKAVLRQAKTLRKLIDTISGNKEKWHADYYIYTDWMLYTHLTKEQFSLIQVGLEVLGVTVSYKTGTSLIENGNSDNVQIRVIANPEFPLQVRIGVFSSYDISTMEERRATGQSLYA